MKHTPTPYVTVTSNEKCPLPTGIPIAIHRKDEPWKSEGAICEMVAQGGGDKYGGRYDSELTSSTAAFIVEACNSYEDLHRTLDIIYKERDGLLTDAILKARETRKLKKERDALLVVAYRAERKISECTDDQLADDWKDIRDNAREAIALCEGKK